jgi:uncharacterized membrane protein YphA (DoxX/SURF4 family)
MNTLIWIIQVLLAVVFAMAGMTKSTQTKEKLVKSLPWVNDYSMATIRFIGIAELLGAIGLIVPWYTGIMPLLTPAAAVGFAVTMILAAIHHSRKREYRSVSMNVILFFLAVTVATYRF